MERLLDKDHEIQESENTDCGTDSEHSEVSNTDEERSTDLGADAGAHIVHAINEGQSEGSLAGIGDVGDEAVLSNVVGDIGTTDIIDQLEVEEVPADLGEEPVVDAIGDTGQELTKNREEQQSLPSMSIRPGSRQQRVQDSEILK